jgi:serine protease Do
MDYQNNSMENNSTGNNSTENVSISNNSSENKSWESGIKFVEEKRPKKVARFLALLLVVFFSASVGGILGGYYVKNNYVPQATVALNTSSQSPRTVTTSSGSSKTSVAQVAEIVGPAVVGIRNNVTGWSGWSGWSSAGGTMTQGTGSGIIFDASGYIVTNYHVIDGASKLVVTLPGGKKIDAKLVGGDPETDLAVIKVDGVKDLPVAKLGDSSQVRVGDTAIAIGNPLGEEFAGTVTAGIISAVNREIDDNGETYKYIQTDASINPGNSGGALCNDAGEVIGINTAKIGSAEGIGLSIPINTAKPIINEIIQKGKVSKPFLGIEYVFIDQSSSAAWNVPVGVGIENVVNGGPAEKAGIQPKDIMVSFGGTDLKQENSLKAALKNYKVGDEISAKIWRNGKTLDIKIKLGDSASN